MAEEFRNVSVVFAEDHENNIYKIARFTEKGLGDDYDFWSHINGCNGYSFNGPYDNEVSKSEHFLKPITCTELLSYMRGHSDVGSRQVVEMLNMAQFSMLKIIDGINTDNQSKEIVYGVSSYHYVFERMVDTVFGNQDDLSEFYPQAYWMLDDVNKQEGASLRPDTVRIDGEKAYIFDSKYYTFGKLPTTSDIQKQITYAEYLETQKGHLYSPIKNAFILPFDRTIGAIENGSSWKYIGHAKTDWKKENGQDIQPAHYVVYGYYIDTTDLIHRYRNSWDEAVTSLVLDLSQKDAKKTETKA